MTTPKTIVLYGRGKRRYPIVPGVWEHCVDRGANKRHGPCKPTIRSGKPGLAK